jgi:hypothetical protein
VEQMVRRAGILLALALALASCGDGGDSSHGTLADAADRTLDTRTANLSVDATVEVDGLPSARIRMEGDGQMDLERNLVQLELEAAVPEEDERIEMEEVMTGNGSVVYLRSPRFLEDLPDGKEWVKLDLVKASKELGVDPTALPQASQNDPAEMLRFLRAVGRVRQFGWENLDGVATNHYKANVDVRRYLDLVPAGRRADARRSVRRLIDLMGGRSRIPMDVWVDESDLVRRLAMDMRTTLPGGSSMRMTFDMRFSDFGSDVDIEVPDEDETIDYGDLVGALQPTSEALKAG